MKTIEKLKNSIGDSKDFIFRDIMIGNLKITMVFSEVLISSDSINQFVLKTISKTISEDDNISSLKDFLLNILPGHNVKEIKEFKEVEQVLLNGYTILVTSDDKVIAIETRAYLDRGITEATNEQVLQGPKDAFTENFNKNLGLLRKRIKTTSLWTKDVFIGKQTNTKVAICYMNNIVEDKIVNETLKKLESIEIDGILDITYLKDSLSTKKSLFPTMMVTERPDVASMALLEGKIVIIADNSPYALVLPCFLVDFFHTSDDYYQKDINITFIRIIRLLAFLLAIFLPAYYIAVTTHNQDSLSLDLLINFTSQRSSVPFPALVEAIIMSICFEILRECDTRIPSSMGTAVSILGGLVLGEAAVNAGIISPIMIIVIAISATSGLLFSSMEFISAIRFWRLGMMFLATLLGIYGIFLGIIVLIISLCDIELFDKPYLAPFAPFVKSGQFDGIVKVKTKLKLRNPLLSQKNKVRGR